MLAHPNADELQPLQHEVQRLLGRCLWRLQQYERLMKAIVANHEIAGPVHAVESLHAKRIDGTAGKTLGALVGDLLGSCVVSDAIDPPAEAAAPVPEDGISFSTRIRLLLPAEQYAQTQDSLKELVLLRNGLVHHFIDQHDLWSMDGCRNAQDALLAAYSRIDQHYRRLWGWAEQMVRVSQLAAEFHQSDTFRDFMFDGIAPDGTVNWPAAGSVRALRQAAGELALDGWTAVASAGRWIAEHAPEQLPAKYGCSSWRQVIHESHLFELRYREVDGRREAWYRVKSDHADLAN